MGPTSQQGAPWGWARPVGLRPTGAAPDVFSVPEILKYSRKNHTTFSEHLKNFYFLVIVYYMDKSENRKIIAFLLYLIKIIESKSWVQKVVSPKFIHLMLIEKNPSRRLIKSY